jgi:hypothetical protein
MTADPIQRQATTPADLACELRRSAEGLQSLASDLEAGEVTAGEAQADVREITVNIRAAARRLQADQRAG